MYIATKWNPIYWNTACLIVNSGSLDNGILDDNDDEDDEEKDAASTDYAKMAKALGDIINAGIKIALVDINTSSFGFKPDVENNQILFGLKGLMNVSDELIATIIKNRPYASPKDFFNKVKPNKQAMISLIKSGAFDNMMDRKECMAWYIWFTCDKKSKLTLLNLPSLFRNDIIPVEDDEKLKIGKRIYEFNRYLKACCKSSNPQFYLLDNRAVEFITEIEKEEMLKVFENNFLLNAKEWDKVYQKEMNVFRDWLSLNKDVALQQLNDKIFMDDWNKYARGNLSSWEMEVMCFYYHPHELINIDLDKYGLSNFADLPEEPEVERVFYKKQKQINIYKLSKIYGTCIAKNKTKSVVSLLTPDGVVNVKFRKDDFSFFDKRISEYGSDGVKHIKEKSWFDRGSMIIVMGMRQGDDFIVKKYAHSIGHHLYKITEVLPNNEIILQNERYKGDIQE